MSLASTVRKGVATANKITRTLQCYVIHECWVGNTTAVNGVKRGKSDYAVGIQRLALVEHYDTEGSMPSMRETRIRAKVTFLGPIAGNGAEGRREPIDPRDRITLPDGFVGNVLDVKGLDNPETHFPYLYEVTLGG